MKNLYEEALNAYIDMLTIHIDTKTRYPVFHEHTERFCEKLFDVAHRIGERYTDLGGSLRDDTLLQKEQAAGKILGDLRRSLETYIRENELSIGTAHLMGWLVSDLEEIEWSAKSFL